MFARSLTRDFSPKRLRNLLIVFFFALAVPTGVLISQAYSQLKWEAYYQYRGMAEELTGRIDGDIAARINTAEARNFTDYAFLVVSGDPSANFLQRSPLSEYPIAQDLPGVIGYFQVGANGEFSTPLLPPQGTAREDVGINVEEYAQRLQLATEIQNVLADNQLVRSRPEIGIRRTVVAKPETRGEFAEEEIDADRFDIPASRHRGTTEKDAPPIPAMTPTVVDESVETAPVGGLAFDESYSRYAAESLASAAEKQSIDIDDNEIYSQQIFDQLNQSRESPQRFSDVASTLEPDDEIGAAIGSEQRNNAIGKISDLKLDAALQKKSELLEAKETGKRRQVVNSSLPARAKRVEQSALPESVLPGSPADASGRAGLVDLRINTFESEVDPYEFSLLNSGHFVLFRKVWRNGERYIQGLLIDQQIFLRDTVVQTFRRTALSAMSDLAIAYQDDVISTISGRINSSYTRRAAEMEGALLHQSALTAPLGSVQLIFSINQLPAGPGASVLAWITIIIAIVFLSGFYALYRIGLSQINVARQQQDFVSAVSHELKTPLTSIRMYGEMLKEGWADDEKRQQYYGYIHDESERLTRLISNVLQLAKITRNEPQFDMKPMVVGELMSQMESKIARQVESAGVELSFERNAETDKATINIDDDCFAQIIINLVDNAIKFSKDAADKRIEIRAILIAGKTVTFSVRDYGPGVQKDQMKKIFRLFYRSESELTRETVGTGIGLAIVHQLTTAMNGKVDIVNRHPGAEFALTFPLV